MKNFERRGFSESLDQVIASVARAYGFTSTPTTIAKKHIADATSATEENTVLITTLAETVGDGTMNVQSWGVLKSKGASRAVFTITNPKHSIAQAFVVKASLATAEASGFSDCKVLLSSVGDEESRRRYVREMGNFFKKNAKAISDEFGELDTHEHPDEAVHTISESASPLKESLPRTIDFLSEPSRKVMLETISLLESLDIPYELNPRLSYIPGVNRELLFGIEGSDKKGNRHLIASGGRFQTEKKAKDSKKHEPNIIGIAVNIPEPIDAREMSTGELPTCFVVHVGEAAKLKAFTLLDSLWRAQIALSQAILMESIQNQMELAQQSGAKYITIVGQREALDGTAILKNVSTQFQETMTTDKLVSRLAKTRA